MAHISKNTISPDYPRIPHLDSRISQMTHDDILPDCAITFPISCFLQEKVDGANCGVSWDNGPILRNRNFILKKGYSNIHTPAKIQFKSAWNWVHQHEGDIKEIESRWEGKITIYGEWMYFKHSLFYDKLPDLFLAYDIYSVDDKKFISLSLVKELIKGLNICFINYSTENFNSISDIKKKSEVISNYRNGYAEGIVLKTVSGNFIKSTYKVVNQFFNRREDFNEGQIERNILL